jgi:hypothetical protein
MENAVVTVNETWALLDPIWKLLGFGGVTFTGAVGIAWLAFKWFGEKWIENKFQQNLEAAKTEQSREMERLRHRIATTFDRVARLHTKEFDVLPEIWGRLVEANGWGWQYISPVQSYPDLNRMPIAELEEFIESTEFTKTQKASILGAHDKFKKFAEVRELHWYSGTMEKIRDFNLLFRKNGIFLQPELKADIDKMFKLIHNAVTEHHMNEVEEIKPRIRDDFKKYREESNELFEKIEKDVSSRLWDSTTAKL